MSGDNVLLLIIPFGLTEDLHGTLMGVNWKAIRMTNFGGIASNTTNLRVYLPMHSMINLLVLLDLVESLPLRPSSP
jgi:hypothetical protein